MKNWDLSNRDDVYRLIEESRKGSVVAQRVLYETMSGKMLYLCYRYVNDMDEARDLMHDGMIKVFDSLRKYQHTGSFEGWVRRIILNNMLDYLRRKNKMLSSDDLDYRAESTNVTDRKFEDEFTRVKAEILLNLIKKLPYAYKMVFNLYVMEDFTHKEIAEFLGISEGTSKSNLSKAKQKLRELYYQKYPNKTD